MRVPGIIAIFSASALLLSGGTGCLKQTPDGPPDITKEDPELTVNTSIRQLKAMPAGIALPEDIIIAGVVVMSDKSGNYFKSIVLQDSSGGIEVALDQRYLYADYPVGRRVYIKCGGLFLGVRAGMISLGYTPDANGYVRPIPGTMIRDFVFPGRYPVVVHPDTVSVFQLTLPDHAQHYLNTLIVLKDVEFVDSHASVPYALPPEEAAATVRMIRDCSGVAIPLRSSAYADFQPVKTPSANGMLTALYTRFNDMPQLYIRDTADIRFRRERCNSLPPAGSTISIQQLRQLFQEEGVLPDYAVAGVVISDREHRNTPAHIFIFQGHREDAGIKVLLSQVSPFDLGDSLVINVGGGRLVSYYGALALDGVALRNIRMAGRHRKVAPEVITVAQLKVHAQRFDSRLVRIKNIYWLHEPATLNGQSGNLSFSDGTDTMNHFCEQEAVFKNEPVRQHGASSITGYAFLRNDEMFLKMRNPGTPDNDLKY